MSSSQGNGNQGGGKPNLPGQPFDPNAADKPKPYKSVVIGLVATAVVFAGISLGGIAKRGQAPVPMEPLPTVEPTTVAADRGETESPSPVVSAKATTVPKSVTVQVAGQVRSPGVIQIESSARVFEAINKAGGPTGEADMDAVNLAEWVKDGGKIVVPAKQTRETVSRGGRQSPAPATDPAPEAAKPQIVNINTATVAELDVLPGVGPKMAAKIVAYRETRGSFKSVSDVAEVPGMGPKRFGEMKAWVTVD